MGASTSSCWPAAETARCSATRSREGAAEYGDWSALAIQGADRGLLVADLNGDGALDVASVGATSSNFALFLNDRSGTLAEPTYHGIGSTQSEIHAADVNGDGALDVIGLNVDGFSVLLGNR